MDVDCSFADFCSGPGSVQKLYPFFPVNKQRKKHIALTYDERLEGRDREEESKK